MVAPAMGGRPSSSVRVHVMSARSASSPDPPHAARPANTTNAAVPDTKAVPRKTSALLSLRSNLRPETLEWWLNRISVDRSGRRPYLLSGTIALATAVALWVNLGWAPHRIRLLLAGLLLGLALFS